MNHPTCKHAPWPGELLAAFAHNLIYLVIRPFVRRFLCFLACRLTVTPVAADEPQGNDNQGNEKWLEPARSKLMHVIGGMPFFPHRANTPGNLVLNVKDFDNAQVCVCRLFTPYGEEGHSDAYR